MISNPCPNCQSQSLTATTTYKHIWFTCNDCGVVQRQRRTKHPLSFALARVLIQKTRLKNYFGRTLLPQHEIIAEEKKFYDYYHDAAKRGVKGSTWQPIIETIIENARSLNIDLNERTILDISGGPGFLTERLKPIAKRVVLTEFSQYAVDGMIAALNIEAVKFDYNSDYLPNCVSGKFDVVFIVYSIGFCNNLRNFVHALRQLLSEQAVVYLCHSPPTLGQMLRWQFDEYTYTRSWPLDIVAKYFGEIGMIEVARRDEGAYQYNFNWFNKANRLIGKIFVRFHRLIALYYLLKAVRPFHNINRELIQKNTLQVFRFR